MSFEKEIKLINIILTVFFGFAILVMLLWVLFQIFPVLGDWDSIFDVSGTSQILGDWQRVSPSTEPISVMGSNAQSVDVTCALTAPVNISFYKDGKYAANGILFAGGDFVVVKKGTIRLQTIKGLDTVQFTKNNGQLILTFNSVMGECTAIYEQ